MANTYEWKISQLVCRPEHAGEVNVVYDIIWRLDGTDGQGHFGEAYGTTAIAFDPSVPHIPYDELTKEVVIGWLEANLGEEGLTNARNVVDRAISLQITPVSVTPTLPWGDDSNPPLVGDANNV